MDDSISEPTLLQRTRWAGARLLFIVYISMSVATVVGGFITAPLMTWYFFGDWRFWRHLRPGLGLLPHGVSLLYLMVTEKKRFMFSVPLDSPPKSEPDPAVSALHTNWVHGSSCGTCNNCCKAFDKVCPLLEQQHGYCRGYNSFYWRYFNCGRYPSMAEEISFYNCPKWILVAPPSMSWKSARAA